MAAQRFLPPHHAAELREELPCSVNHAMTLILAMPQYSSERSPSGTSWRPVDRAS